MVEEEQRPRLLYCYREGGAKAVPDLDFRACADLEMVAMDKLVFFADLVLLMTLCLPSYSMKWLKLRVRRNRLGLNRKSQKVVFALPRCHYAAARGNFQLHLLAAPQSHPIGTRRMTIRVSNTS